MTIDLTIPQKILYDSDFLGWLDQTTQQLRNQNYNAVDWENLLEELDAMGRREKRKLESNLVILLQHLLKWQHQPSKRSGSWKSSIREHRRRIRKDLEDSPSLTTHLIATLPEAYSDAREAAADETDLELSLFPINCDYSIAQILDRDFLPGAIE
jgi:hypothetical protein